MAQGKPLRRAPIVGLAGTTSRAEIFRNNLFRETEIGAMISNGDPGDRATGLHACARRRVRVSDRHSAHGILSTRGEERKRPLRGRRNVLKRLNSNKEIKVNSKGFSFDFL